MSAKVLYCIGGVNPSGAETRLVHTAIAHSNAGFHDVTILLRQSLYQGLKLKGIFFPENQKLLLVRDGAGTRGSKLIYLLFFIINLLRIAVSGRFDVLHVAIFNPLHFVCLRPLVRSFYYEVTSPDVADRVVTSLLVKLIRKFDGGIYYICVSKSVASKMRNERGVSIRSKPYCRYKPDISILAKKTRTVVYAHRLVERKNPLIAAKAFVELARLFPDWDFRFYGTGDLEVEVEKVFAMASLSNAKYLGYLPNLSSVLSTSKVFVSLISPDNYPSQSVFEAMSFGNALFLSDQGMSKEMFIHANGKVCELKLDTVIYELGDMLNNFDEVWCKESQIVINNLYGFDKYFNDHLRLIGLQ